MKNRNIVISLLLSICMIFTMMPLTSFADPVADGSQDNPYTVEYTESDGNYWYYRGCEYTGTNNELWFKVTAVKAGKIKARVTPWGKYDESILDGGVVLHGKKASPLTENPYMDQLWTEDYFTVNAGEIIRVQVKFNENVKLGDMVDIELEYFGINNEDEFAVELSKRDYTWQKGTRFCPRVENVWFFGYNVEQKALVPGVDYEEKVTYKNNTGVGIAEVVIVGKGVYSGTRVEYFRINPKGTKINSIKGAKKSMTVKWTAQKTKMPKYISGYEIEYSDTSEFEDVGTVKVSGYKSSSKTIKKLSKGKYYVRIRTRSYVDGKNLYSRWSPVKTVKVK